MSTLTISGNTITINNVSVNWDNNTRFTLKGLITVATGEYGTMIYNSSSGKAITVNVLPTPPGP